MVSCQVEEPSVIDSASSDLMQGISPLRGQNPKLKQSPRWLVQTKSFGNWA